MAKKYEKVGTADIYREKKNNEGCFQIIGAVVVILVVLFLIGACSSK
ncbi:hypothetical protein [Cerasicoccus frondis]|nr:hypothetical protein [Cerasicoccus frondis]